MEEEALNLMALPDWKNILSLIFKYCDFKVVLTVMQCSKILKEQSKNEIRKRQQHMVMNPDHCKLSEDFCFYAKRCTIGFSANIQYQRMEDGTISYSQYRYIKIVCGKYCNTHHMKENGCNVCYKKKIELEK